MGPFHFGGQYQWQSFSYGIDQSDVPIAHKLQTEFTATQSGISKFSDSFPVPASETKITCRSEGKDLTQLTFIEVETCGGPTEISTIAVWKNWLVADKSSWAIIDRGTEQVPVWEIAETNHTRTLIMHHC